MSKVIQNLFTWTEENLSRGLPRASHNGNGIKSDQQELLCDSELENEATKFYEKIMASKDCQLCGVFLQDYYFTLKQSKGKEFYAEPYS